MSALSLTLSALLLSARPVSQEEARLAAQAWSLESGATFGNQGQAGRAEPIFGDGNLRMGYCVSFSRGGSLIVAADTEIVPVLASIPKGSFKDLPPRHPLRTLVLDGLSRRFRLLGLGKGERTLSAVPRADELARSAKSASRRWAGLLGEKISPLSLPFQTPPARLIASLPGWEDGTFSHWNQSEGNSYLNLSLEEGYSRYTPNHDVAGCVAIAGTAIIQYLGVEQGPSTNELFACSVEGEAKRRKLRPFGIPYDWSLLPQAGWMPPPNLSEEAKDLLGRVPYEVGISVNMSYGYAGSSASMDSLAWSLRFMFGLPGAKKLRFDGNARGRREYLLPIEADLRAGRPVAMAIEDSSEAHAVVANGFGRDGAGTDYTRVFMGWGGNGDAWFVLPDVVRFFSVAEIICNIDRMPGRYPLIGSLTNGEGKPVAYHDLSVRISTGETRSVKTDLNGNYCFLVNGLHDLSNPGDAYDEWVEISVRGREPIRVEIPASQRHGLRGPDFVLVDAPSHPFMADLRAARQEALGSGRKLLVLFDNSRAEGGSALFHALQAEAGELNHFVCAYTDGTQVLVMKPSGLKPTVGVFDPNLCIPFREYESDLSGRGMWNEGNGLLGETSDPAGIAALLDSFSGEPVLGEEYGGVTRSWLREYFPNRPLSTEDEVRLVAEEDTDGDGFPNWQEYVLGTDPTDPASTFRITAFHLDAGGAPVLSYPKVEGRLYLPESAPSPVGPWRSVLPGDTFFRVRVQFPRRP